MVFDTIDGRNPAARIYMKPEKKHSAKRGINYYYLRVQFFFLHQQYDVLVV